jgi:hypothetical protein
MRKTKVIYQMESETLEQAVRVIFEVMGITGMEPDSIVLHDGRVLTWNNYAAHQFVGEGRITESEFIEMSLSGN